MLTICVRLLAVKGCSAIQRCPRLVKAATLSSMLVTASKPNQGAAVNNVVFIREKVEPTSWLSDLLETLRVIIRSIQMAILLAPLIVTAPFAAAVPRAQKLWLDLLVGTIQVCGPVYVKLGQWASTRRDLFHPKLCDHLSRLQRRTNVHPWKHTQKVLERNSLTSAFDDFDNEPIGSGCCAQVYKAKYQGSEVAVKVLHPEIKQRFIRDLRVLRSCLNGVSWMFPQLQWLSVQESLEEFASLMNVQVNLKNEEANLIKFNQNFERNDMVTFPKPIHELCSEEVLVESFEHGVHIGTLIQDLQGMTDERRKTLAAKGVDMFLNMVFRHNFVHCDLHPGNILVNEMDNLIVLDPGLTASLSPKDKRNFMAVFSAVIKGDGRTVGQEILQQSEQECQDPQLFVAQIENIVVSARQTLSLAKIDVADLLQKVFNVLREHRVKLEPNFTSVIISIMVLEGLGRTLDPDMDLLWAAAPFLLK